MSFKIDCQRMGEDHLGRFAAERSRRPARVPTVLSLDEVQRVIEQIREGSMHRVQQLLGHGSLKTTMLYTHVMNKPAIAVTSPLDRLRG
jgi:site-specific recombinase XerD